jgi:hypothetical protein
VNENLYLHRKHHAIEAAIKDGHTDTGIAAQLHVDRRAVARVRKMLGIPPMTNSTSKLYKILKYSTAPDADGHVLWTGRRNHGTPVIRHKEQEYPVAAVLFEERTGRKPVGFTRSECGREYCVAPSHLCDDVERLRVRLQLRALYGREMPGDQCSQGHPWPEHMSVGPEPRLVIYCRTCGTNRARRSREAAQAEQEES